jgi:hypothetical protein
MSNNLDSALRLATQDELLERLANGESLNAICKSKNMPSRVMVRHWQNADDEFDLSIMRAREDGMAVIAERAVERAKSAVPGQADAALERLAFDADRWYVGKLSNAFSDNKAKDVNLKVGIEDETKAWLGLKS